LVQTMDKKKTFLTIQSILWILAAVLLIAGALRIYMNGVALRAADPMADIYTVETIGRAARFAVPVLLAAIIMTVICAVSGIRDESADKPVPGFRVSKKEPAGEDALRKRSRVRMVLFAAALAFIIIGIFNGSMNDVFVKASKICTECIGLG